MNHLQNEMKKIRTDDKQSRQSGNKLNNDAYKPPGKRISRRPRSYSPSDSQTQPVKKKRVSPISSKKSVSSR